VWYAEARYRRLEGIDAHTELRSPADDIPCAVRGLSDSARDRGPVRVREPAPGLSDHRCEMVTDRPER